jgi:hypothetical protein
MCHFSTIWWFCHFPMQQKQWCSLLGGKRCKEQHLKQIDSNFLHGMTTIGLVRKHTVWKALLWDVAPWSLVDTHCSWKCGQGPLSLSCLCWGHIGHVRNTGLYYGICHHLLRPLWRVRCKWHSNKKTDLKERWEGINWINLVKDRNKWQALVNMLMNL